MNSAFQFENTKGTNAARKGADAPMVSPELSEIMNMLDAIEANPAKLTGRRDH